MPVRYVIFTDLDATLLDNQTYSFKPARPVLEKINKLKIPLVICTSKTRAETEAIGWKLGLKHPFIVENGGAVYIPENYFPARFFQKLGLKTVKKNGYRVIELGTSYLRLRRFFHQVRKRTGLRLIGFGDLSIDQIAALTGLGKKEVRRARLREYDEPFFLEGGPESNGLRPGKKSRESGWDKRAGSGGIKRDELIRWKEGEPNRVEKILKLIRREASQYGLRLTEGGRFYHLTGHNDKGRAVRMLKKLYRLKFGKIITIGLGDSANDWPMLKAVDYQVLVTRPDGAHSNLPPGIKNIYETRKPGPQGWAEALEYFFSRFKICESRTEVSTAENLLRQHLKKK